MPIFMGQPKKTSDLVRLQARKIRHGTGKEKVGRNFSVRSSEGPEGLEEVAGTVETVGSNSVDFGEFPREDIANFVS
jgi:hypothetical protein